jgi:hypothetical protein
MVQGKVGVAFSAGLIYYRPEFVASIIARMPARTAG